MTHIRSRPQEVTVAEYGKLYTDLHDQHSRFLDTYQAYITRTTAQIDALALENYKLKAELAALRTISVTGTFTPAAPVKQTYYDVRSDTLITRVNFNV